MSDNLMVKFRGRRYLLIGSLHEGGPIATVRQYSHGLCSFAQLTSDGRIMRFNEQIGRRDDLELLGPAPKVTLQPGAIGNIVEAFMTGGWKYPKRQKVKA